MEEANVKVFISYAWSKKEYSDKILNFANGLRKNESIDAMIDQYEDSPEQGWPIWMEQQIAVSKFVLIAIDKIYFDKFNDLKVGKGVTWEITQIYQQLYNMNGKNTKFIPIIFDDKDKEFIPIALQPYTIYNISNEQEYRKLCNRLNGIPNTIKPNLAKKPLSVKERKMLFVSSYINIDLWNKAKWKGVVFVSTQNDYSPWYVGILFEGDKSSAIKIFDEWIIEKNIDKEIAITFLEGEIEGLRTGYTCLIGNNFNRLPQKTEEIGFTTDETLFVTVTRFQRMNPVDNFAMFNKFKSVVQKNKQYIYFCPITLKNSNKGLTPDNFEIHYERQIEFTNIIFKNADDINKNDYESIAIPKYNSSLEKEI